MYGEMRRFVEILLHRYDILGGAARLWRCADLSNSIEGIKRLGATLRPTRAMQGHRAILDALEHLEDQT